MIRRRVPANQPPVLWYSVPWRSANATTDEIEVVVWGPINTSTTSVWLLLLDVIACGVGDLCIRRGTRPPCRPDVEQTTSPSDKEHVTTVTTC
ncbi:N-acetylneuraminate epimerase [Trichinella pseudospiralis]